MKIMAPTFGVFAWVVVVHNFIMQQIDLLIDTS